MFEREDTDDRATEPNCYIMDEFVPLLFGSTAEFCATEEKWDKFVFREF